MTLAVGGTYHLNTTTSKILMQGVQRRIVLVVKFFENLKLFVFAFVVATMYV